MAARTRRASRAGSPLRVVAVTLAVVLLLAIAADLGLRFWAQRWLEGRLDDTLESAARPDVALRGFPFLFAFARGELSGATVTWEGVEAGGLRLERVELDLQEVGFSQGDLLAGRSGDVDIGRGTGTLEVGEQGLNAFLEQRGVPVSLELRRSEVRASISEGAGPSAVGRLRLEGRSLVFEPSRVEGGPGVTTEGLAFAVRLPRVLEGLTYEGIEVREAALTLRVGMRDTVVQLAARSLDR